MPRVAKPLLFFLAMFISLMRLTGQVIYTDLTPDRDFTSREDILIDTDGDGTTDFTLKLETIHEYDTYQYIYTILPASGAQVALSNDSAAVIHAGENIGPSLSWSNSEEVGMMYVMQYYGYSGPWYGVKNGFLGLRSEKDGMFHYCWLRIHARPEYYFMQAVDYGWENTPGQPLIAGEGIPQGATSVFAADTRDYFDGRDFDISFTRAFDEDLFSEYRVIFAKATDTLANDLNVMNLVPPERYTSFVIDSMNDLFTVDFSPDSTSVDREGDTLSMLHTYRAHLLNVARNGLPIDNVLSVPSDTVLMRSVSQPAARLVAWDAGNTHSAADIRLSFHPAEKEWDLKEYRLFIARPEDIPGFEPNAAIALSPDRYTLHLPDGNDAELAIDANQKDIYGNLIQEDVFYQALALSVADSLYSFTSSLSAPSREFMLTDPNRIIAGQENGNYLVSHDCDLLFSSSEIWENEVQIDLNRDGMMDYRLYYKEQISPMFFNMHYTVQPERDNEVLVCHHEGHNNWIDVLKEKEAIGEGYEWSAENSILIDAETNAWSGANYWNGHMSGADFYTGTSYFIGFRLMDGEVPQYAWLRLEGNVFIDYAFQDFNSSVPGHADERIFTIYPNPAREKVCLKSLSGTVNMTGGHITIFNSLGLEMESLEIRKENECIPVSGYPDGLYHVIITPRGSAGERSSFIKH